MEKITNRQNFDDINMASTPHILYDIDGKKPSGKDFIYGAIRTIVLRNRSTGHLERIKFKLSGAVSYPGDQHYCWYWGKICQNAVLVFNFKPDGLFDQAAVIFCGEAAKGNDLREILNTHSTFPAEFTATDYFPTNLSQMPLA